MTTLSHKNEFAHRMLTDQGVFVHTHCPAEFGCAAYDLYEGDSHDVIIDASGLIVHSQAIDWELARFIEEMHGVQVRG